MNFLSRKVHTQEAERIEGQVIHREIEITVQREWVSVNGGARSTGHSETPLAPYARTNDQLQDASFHNERERKS